MYYDINAYSSDEEPVRRPKIIRFRPNYFEEFDKKRVEDILGQIDEEIRHPTNKYDLSARDQLLLTLNFYANGSFLRVAGDFSGVSKSTVRRVSRAIASLGRHYIEMPSTRYSTSKTKMILYQGGLDQHMSHIYIDIQKKHQLWLVNERDGNSGHV
ncbi:hypothetical protein NQ318_010554 [Aromia moschata]|uniref:Nuclease HARBI1 n=1 Tax=Aromia moschata TaxID=1265417 RepID=A0AAV8XB18_9CUCU|nr:hypothetical protein NQ318_010554 [Aromia moschata]